MAHALHHNKNPHIGIDILLMPVNANSQSRKSPIPVLLAGLIAWVIALYYKGLFGPFMFDDQILFPSTHISEPNFHAIMRALSTHGSGIFGRPIPILTFIFNYNFLGPDPFGYKLINLAIHLSNTFLVFLFSYLIFKATFRSERTGLTSPATLALLTATIWAIHPIQVSTVLYVFQRMMLLSTFFTICALICYTSARTHDSSNIYKALLLFIVFPILQICALASKENGALIPIYIILLESVVFRFKYSTNREATIGKSFIFLGVLLPIILAVLYFFTHMPQVMEGYNGRDFSLLDRLRTESVALTFYLKLILLPNISEMSLFHDGFPIYREFSKYFFGSVLLLVLLAVIGVLSNNKLKVISIGVGLFFIAHLLESTFIPLELVFEHRNYFALSGLCLICVWLLSLLRDYFPARPIGNIAIALVIFSLSAMTFSRSLEWSDEFIFNTIAVENKPESQRAIKALVTSYTNVRQFDKAQKILSTAKTRFPNNTSLDVSQVILSCLSGNTSVEEITRAGNRLKSSPLRQEIPPTITTLLKVWSDGHCEDISIETINDLLTIAVNNPEKRMPQIFKSHLWHTYYQTNSILGDYETAYKSLAQAQNESPDHPELLAVLTQLQITRGENRKAEKNMNHLSKISKKYGGAYNETLDSLEAKLSDGQLTDNTIAE